MKNFLLALSSGILLALGWPTYGFPLLLFFAFVPLLFLEFRLRKSAVKRAGWKTFGWAYLSFFIWNVITSYLIYFSTPTGGIFAILANSLLMTLVFTLYHWVAKRVNFTAACSFLASLWICFEYLHLHWEFSWPWLNLGNAFSEFTDWVQWYEYTGTFGGTLWIWIVNLSIFRAVVLFQQHRERPIVYRAILRNALLILVPIGLSYLIFINYEVKTNKITQINILQPNINPYTEKYFTSDQKIASLLEKMTDEKTTESTDLLLMPETVFASGTKINGFQNSPAHQFSENTLDKFPNLNVLGGISFFKWIREKDKKTSQSNRYRPGLWLNDYNSAFMIRRDTSDQIYHKSKLVVGVENFPYKDVLKPVLGDIMIDLGGTVSMKTTQENREVFSLKNGSKAAPIICYESVYGEYVSKYVRNGADFLTIITNDAWWGNTQGHLQHFSYAKLRAVETRRDVVRSANTGISGIINQKGEVVKKMGYNQQGSLTGEVHLNSEKTFYVKFGDLIARVSQFLVVFIFLFAIVKFRKGDEF
jgi:apolipoprotein N-acyltransferase